METNRESHCWWFSSYNSPRFSPWLESTLAEINGKTKTMLKLIEEDADSFAQRAEMYYKKRPELIRMVEDFYRTHISLAERYDQLKSHRVVHVKSPLRHSLSLPKDDEYVLDSVNLVKTFDSFTEAAYSYEESAESEVDDPEQDEDIAQIDKPFGREASHDELMKLRDELDRLREENENQRSIIKQKDEEKEEIVKQLSDNIRKLKKESAAVRNEHLGVMKQTGEVIVPFDEVTNLKDEIKYDKQVKKQADEVIQVMKKFEAEKTKKMYLEDELARKEVEIVEVIGQLEQAMSEIAKVREEMRRMNEQLKDALVKKDGVIRQLEEALTERNGLIRQLNGALLEKDKVKCNTISHLKDALAQKDEQKCEVIRQMKNTLAQKDEEKREAIRQLSVAMEMIREESKHLKKSIVNNSPRKSSAKAADIQILKGVNLGNVFNPFAKCQNCAMPL